MDINEKIEKYLKEVNESEDGVMAYTTAHPHGGRGRHPRYRYGKNITCPFCNKTIDLSKIKE